MLSLGFITKRTAVNERRHNIPIYFSLINVGEVAGSLDFVEGHSVHYPLYSGILSLDQVSRMEFLPWLNVGYSKHLSQNINPVQG